MPTSETGGVVRAAAREEAREEGAAENGSGGPADPASEEGRDAGAEGVRGPSDNRGKGAAETGEALDPAAVDLDVEAAASQVHAALCLHGCEARPAFGGLMRSSS